MDQNKLQQVIQAVQAFRAKNQPKVTDFMLGPKGTEGRDMVDTFNDPNWKPGTQMLESVKQVPNQLGQMAKQIPVVQVANDVRNKGFKQTVYDRADQPTRDFYDKKIGLNEYAKQSGQPSNDMMTNLAIETMSGVAGVTKAAKATNVVKQALQGSGDDLIQIPSGLQKIATKTDKGYKFSFIHNTEKAPRPSVEDTFGQNIEPAGKYMGLHNKDFVNKQKEYYGKNDVKNFEYGEVEFKKPLIIDTTGKMSKDWKVELSKEYGGKTGKDLTRALIKDGYDGIITTDKGNPSESIYFDRLLQEPPKDLVTLHNLSESGIIKADQMGGIPAPSLAITKKDIPFTSFGEISLVGDKNLGSENTYSADVYTRRAPREIKRIDYRASEQAIKELEPYFEKTGEYKWGRVNDLLTTEGEGKMTDLIYYSRKSPSVKSMFLNETRGIDIAPITRQKADGTFVIDERAIDNTIEGYMKDIPEEAFNDWVTRKFSNIFKDSYFRNNRGTKKEYNLDNLLEYMTGRIRGQENFFYGAGTVKSRIAKKFSGVDEIRANKDNLQPHNMSEGVHKKMNDTLFSIIERVKKESRWKDSHSLSLYDQIGQDISSVGPNFTKSKVIQALRKVGIDDPSTALADDVYSFLKELQSSPVEYFEGKPQRAVQLKEFEGALVPKNIDHEVKKILENNKLKIVEYDPSLPDDRKLKLIDNFGNTFYAAIFGISVEEDEQGNPRVTFGGENSIIGRGMREAIEAVKAVRSQK